MIPPTIHFIFGLDENFANIPFSCVHYIAARSAKVINKNYEVVIHYFNEPANNQWWELSKQFVKMDKLGIPPTKIYGRQIIYNAHKADFLRLDILLSEGGVYLDMDTICIKPFDPLLDKKCVMGLEIWEGYINGLCNAVILAEESSPFLLHWQKAYDDFDPHDWNQMSVRKPFEIYSLKPDLIYIEPPESFFRLTWSNEDIELTYEKFIPFHRSYCLHLWETKTYEKYLSKISLEDIMKRDTTYNVLAQRVLTK